MDFDAKQHQQTQHIWVAGHLCTEEHGDLYADEGWSWFVRSCLTCNESHSVRVDFSSEWTDPGFGPEVRFPPQTFRRRSDCLEYVHLEIRDALNEAYSCADSGLLLASSVCLRTTLDRAVG